MGHLLPRNRENAAFPSARLLLLRCGEAFVFELFKGEGRQIGIEVTNHAPIRQLRSVQLLGLRVSRSSL